MLITLNGQPAEVPEGTTVRDLIDRLGLSVCAAELNRELVPHRDRDTRVVHEGDAVEIVTLVGGG